MSYSSSCHHHLPSLAPVNLANLDSSLKIIIKIIIAVTTCMVIKMVV